MPPFPRRNAILIVIGIVFLILGIVLIAVPPVGFIFILIGLAFLASGSGQKEFQAGGSG